MTSCLDGYGPAVLFLTPERQVGPTLIRVGGELDLATADQLVDFVGAMAPEDCREVHLDLAGLGFIDLSGLTALRRADDVVRGRAGRMTVGGLRPLARRLVDLTALAVTIDDDARPRPGAAGGGPRPRPRVAGGGPAGWLFNRRA